MSSFVALRPSNSNSIFGIGWEDGSRSTFARPLKYGSANAYILKIYQDPNFWVLSDADNRIS
jgi:hypothetical protein